MAALVGTNVETELISVDATIEKRGIARNLLRVQKKGSGDRGAEPW